MLSAESAAGLQQSFPDVSRSHTLLRGGHTEAQSDVSIIRIAPVRRLPPGGFRVGVWLRQMANA